jgi:hypothetical protein
LDAFTERKLTSAEIAAIMDTTAAGSSTHVFALRASIETFKADTKTVVCVQPQSAIHVIGQLDRAFTPRSFAERSNAPIRFSDAAASPEPPKKKTCTEYDQEMMDLLVAANEETP